MYAWNQTHEGFHMATLLTQQHKIREFQASLRDPVSEPGSRFSVYQKNGKKIPYVTLISEPTPIVPGRFGELTFDIKREDLTSLDLYGGNKVRNLEFILGDALLKHHSHIATPIPLGSNFSAAFVAHSERLGLRPMLCQVHLANHSQIVDHFDYCRRRQADIITRVGLAKFPLQIMDLMRAKLQYHAYLVAPGGSNTFGVLGHMKAFDELLAAIQNGVTRMPTHIFVGAGTGGTTAGLLASIHIAQLPIKIIAVRCAETVICNRFRIKALANKTLRFLGYDANVNDELLELVECPGHQRYGEPLAEFDSIYNQFYGENGLALDRTYTSKVIQYMRAHKRQEHSKASHYLYWHTYSNVATQEQLKLKMSN
jgi:L-cysteate sulfo-lyase